MQLPDIITEPAAGSGPPKDTEPRIGTCPDTNVDPPTGSSPKTFRFPTPDPPYAPEEMSYVESVANRPALNPKPEAARPLRPIVPGDDRPTPRQDDGRPEPRQGLGLDSPQPKAAAGISRKH